MSIIHNNTITAPQVLEAAQENLPIKITAGDNGMYLDMTNEAFYELIFKYLAARADFWGTGRKGTILFLVDDDVYARNAIDSDDIDVITVPGASAVVVPGWTDILQDVISGDTLDKHLADATEEDDNWLYSEAVRAEKVDEPV
jgi:hypothetical protein